MDFPHQSSNRQLKNMLSVDFRRMFKTKLFYIMFFISLVTPILILVMTSMFDGMVTVDPQTGVEKTIEGFSNTWQIISSVFSAEAMMSMDMTTMMNMNMLFFLIAVFTCIFIYQDFKSGYAKLLFTGRSKKREYVTSKFITCTIQGMSMMIAWLIGAVIGGSIAGLSFELVDSSVLGLVMCILSKMFLVPLFVSIFLAFSSFGKQRLWLSLLGSLFLGMIFYMVVPMMSPLNATIMNAGMCLFGGLIFSLIINLVSNLILRKTDLV